MKRYLKSKPVSSRRDRFRQWLEEPTTTQEFVSSVLVVAAILCAIYAWLVAAANTGVAR